MKHAGPQALDVLEELLVRVRKLALLNEKKRGAFYLKSVGFMHFHEDPAGLFADLKVNGDWQRFPVDTPAQRKTLLRSVVATVAAKTPRAKRAK